MDRFSVRNGLQEFVNQNNCTTTTRRRIWQVFAKKWVLVNKGRNRLYDIVEDILAYFGQEYQFDNSPFDNPSNCNRLNKYICERCEWYKVYDFIEYYLSFCKTRGEEADVTREFNIILEDERTGYHIIDGIVTPITNSTEIDTIEKALTNSPDHVTQSVKKALKLFSDREAPDYNNAIKEMITAVEALCCTIVEGGEDTLGKAINKFTDYGIVLHDNLTTAIKNLYKYTCNEDGKRHGGTTFIESDVEDARFMLVTCSAIINLLMVKWEKAKENKDA